MLLHDIIHTKETLTLVFEYVVSKIRIQILGHPGWLSGLAPPSAQGTILEALDRVPHQAPCMKPTSPSACVSASLSVSLMNK